MSFQPRTESWVTLAFLGQKKKKKAAVEDGMDSPLIPILAFEPFAGPAPGSLLLQPSEQLPMNQDHTSSPQTSAQVLSLESEVVAQPLESSCNLHDRFVMVFLYCLFQCLSQNQSISERIFPSPVAGQSFLINILQG